MNLFNWALIGVLIVGQMSLVPAHNKRLMFALIVALVLWMWGGIFLLASYWWLK